MVPARSPSPPATAPARTLGSAAAAILLVVSGAWSQQVPDTAWTPSVPDPAHPAGRGPVVLVDGGHHDEVGADDPQEVETLRDVPYVPDPHPEQRLDFHWPPDAAATVLFLHGGGLSESGERRDSPRYRRVCDPFVADGIACATADYRLAPSFSWPAMPEDVAAAVVKVRELVAARGGNPDRLFLFGHSSGCTLAAVVASDPRYLEAVGLGPSNLAGAIPMGCVLDNRNAALRGLTAAEVRAAFRDDRGDVDRYGTAEGWIAANPSFAVGPHVPPTLVVVARAERFFPAILEQGARFVRRLLEADVPADLVLVPGTHRSSIEDFPAPGDPTFAAIRAFIGDPRAAGAGE